MIKFVLKLIMCLWTLGLRNGDLYCRAVIEFALKSDPAALASPPRP